jgi:hypothetical protein
MHLVETEMAQVVDRSTQTDGFGDRRRACLELLRDGAYVERSIVTVSIIEPPVRKGGRSRRATPDDPTARRYRRADILWPEKASAKSTAEVATSIGQVRR